MDGIVADLSSEWLRRYNRDYNDTLPLERFFATWNTSDNVKPECGSKIFDYLEQPDLYEDVLPIAGALDGVAALRAAGHELIYASACTFGMVDAKAHWLIRNGLCEERRNKLPRNFIPIEDKFWLPGDLLIDDGGHNIKAWVTETRRRAVMLEYPHNATLDMPSMFWSWINRAQDWSGIVRAVEALSR